MPTYSPEEHLEIFARVGITQEAYELLRKEKRRSKLSMAKIVSELIIKNGDDDGRRSKK